MRTGELYELDGLTVWVRPDGEGEPPWRDSPWLVYRYGVSVHAPEGDYECKAYGSRADFEKGKRTPEDMAWMVLDELLSAAYDPDEFFQMATDGPGGREHARRILDMIDTAATLLPALERNQVEIDKHR